MNNAKKAAWAARDEEKRIMEALIGPRGRVIILSDKDGDYEPTHSPVVDYDATDDFNP